MRSFITTIIALVAFASAVPFAAHDRVNGLHIAYDTRHHAHAHTARHGIIAGRSTSYDGSCGSWSGASCPVGFCCGPYSWCGNTVEYCGAGCQADFGQCGSGASSSSSVSSVTDVAETQIIPVANPTSEAAASGGGSSQDGAYIRTYKGDGSAAAGWPSKNEFLSFESMWKINHENMKSSCSNAFSQADNSEQELDDIKSDEIGCERVD